MGEPAQLAKGTAVLIVHVINDLDFPGGEKVLPWAERMADRLVPFLQHARAADVPVVYANDNFGHWRSDFKAVIAHATRPDARGRDVVNRLLPAEHDYFILKPKHSAFFATSLVPLLEYLDVQRLIVAGMATNLCVLLTAQDAHMHEYDISVLSDCCAAESDEDHNWALDQLHRFMGVRVYRSDEVNRP